jgi:NAD(P)-dependent dehydrogenase (short-subunit alcohol dehydrogenase family)
MSSPAGRGMLLVGGNSEIGLAIVRQLAATGPEPVRPILLGRDDAALPQEALEVMQVGFVGTGSLLLESLRRLRAQGHGTLVVLSSVAVARRTVGALGGRAHTVWAPGALRYMFAVVRLLPRAVFRRIPL